MKGFIEIEYDDRKRLIALSAIVAVSENKEPGYVTNYPNRPVATSISLNHGISNRSSPPTATQISVKLTYDEVLKLIEAAQ